MAFESESRSSEQSERTSVSLEDAFWKSLREIASGRNVTVSDLVVSINGGRRQGNLSSAIRLFVLDYYRTHAVASQPSGH
jgi:predicted DNA-binding ribbon-helix-helix protein